MVTPHRNMMVGNQTDGRRRLRIMLEGTWSAVELHELQGDARSQRHSPRKENTRKKRLSNRASIVCPSDADLCPNCTTTSLRKGRGYQGQQGVCIKRGRYPPWHCRYSTGREMRVNTRTPTREPYASPPCASACVHRCPIRPPQGCRPCRVAPFSRRPQVRWAGCVPCPRGCCSPWSSSAWFPTLGPSRAVEQREERASVVDKSHS